MYDHVGSSLVAKFMEGYNTTIFAYGSTGSGKTYTMFGSALDGVVPRAISDIFARKNDSFELSCSMLEIYRETLIDLLVERGDQGDLKVGKSS